MTLEILYITLNTHAVWLSLIIFALPWLVWVLCDLIPGDWEEPWLLSANITLAVVGIAMWAGYLAYASNVGGWTKVIQEAQVLLLLIAPYYILMSFWVARQRLPLARIPAFRTLQGLTIMCGIYLITSWLGRRVYLVFFTRLPFSAFLWILAGLLLIAYIGWRRVIGPPPPPRNL